MLGSGLAHNIEREADILGSGTAVPAAVQLVLEVSHMVKSGTQIDWPGHIAKSAEKPAAPCSKYTYKCLFRISTHDLRVLAS